MNYTNSIHNFLRTIKMLEDALPESTATDKNIFAGWIKHYEDGLTTLLNAPNCARNIVARIDFLNEQNIDLWYYLKSDDARLSAVGKNTEEINLYLSNDIIRNMIIQHTAESIAIEFSKKLEEYNISIESVSVDMVEGEL
jgi:hypothetical protein